MLHINFQQYIAMGGFKPLSKCSQVHIIGDPVFCKTGCTVYISCSSRSTKVKAVSDWSVQSDLIGWHTCTLFYLVWTQYVQHELLYNYDLRLHTSLDKKSTICGWLITHSGKWWVYTKWMFSQNFRVFEKNWPGAARILNSQQREIMGSTII